MKNFETYKKISILKQKLYSTDWIISKISEAVLEYAETGDNSKVVALREKYSKELNDREIWREEINELEQSLQ